MLTECQVVGRVNGDVPLDLVIYPFVLQSLSKRLLAEIALDSGGNVEKAATGDPPRETKVAVRSKRKGTPRRQTRVRS